MGQAPPLHGGAQACNGRRQRNGMGEEEKAERYGARILICSVVCMVFKCVDLGL